MKLILHPRQLRVFLYNDSFTKKGKILSGNVSFHAGH
jgi:hypothetical protein